MVTPEVYCNVYPVLLPPNVNSKGVAEDIVIVFPSMLKPELVTARVLLEKPVAT